MTMPEVHLRAPAVQKATRDLQEQMWSGEFTPSDELYAYGTLCHILAIAGNSAIMPERHAAVSIRLVQWRLRHSLTLGELILIVGEMLSLYGGEISKHERKTGRLNTEG